jgi:hypothetical protein
MSESTHTQALPPLDQIELRIQSCAEEMRELKKLRRAALALEKAEAARRRRLDGQVKQEGVPCA